MRFPLILKIIKTYSLQVLTILSTVSVAEKLHRHILHLDIQKGCQNFGREECLFVENLKSTQKRGSKVKQFIFDEEYSRMIDTTGCGLGANKLKNSKKIAKNQIN